jgi:hypothetical protein
MNPQCLMGLLVTLPTPLHHCVRFRFAVDKPTHGEFSAGLTRNALGRFLLPPTLAAKINFIIRRHSCMEKRHLTHPHLGKGQKIRSEKQPFTE